MSARIVVVEHQESCPAGLVGTWLVEAGARLDVVRPHRRDDLPEPASYDAPLVLGGDTGAAALGGVVQQTPAGSARTRSAP